MFWTLGEALNRGLSLYCETFAEASFTRLINTPSPSLLLVCPEAAPL